MTPRSEHTSSKPGKLCNGPDQGSDAAEDTAPPLASLLVEDVTDLSIKDTLASLLGAVKSLTTGLKEAKPENQQLCALLKNQSQTKEPMDSKVLVPDACFGTATVSWVTLLELRAMWDLSQQADRPIA